MEENNRRQMGTVNDPKGLQIRVSKHTPRYRGHSDKSKCTSHPNYKFRGGKIIRKRCDRACTICGTTSRFLQYNVFGTQKDRRFKTGDKPETTQPVSENRTFQDGHYEQSDKSCKERRLGNFNRFTRCLFSHTNFSSPSKVSTVLRSGQSLPVSSISVRAKDISESVHESGISRSSSFKNAEHQIGSLSRRLASPECNPEIAFTGSTENTQSSFSTRFSGKCRKIAVSTHSGYNLHRGKIFTGQRNSSSNFRQNVKSKGFCASDKRPFRHSKTVFTNARSDGFLHRLIEVVPYARLHMRPMQIKDHSGTARQYLQMLGLMASCIEVVPYARLHMRLMQLHLLYWWKPVSGDLEMQIPGSQHIAGHLNWWLQEANMLKGRSFLQKNVSKTLSTDASLQGWGGTLGRQIVQGLWPPEKQAWHINCLELEAVLLTIKRFLPQLANQSVLIRSDNTTVVQYITRQGGTKSTQLCYKAWELWQLAIDNNIEWKAAHIAGRLNVLPDQLSRVVIRPTEWTLNNTILRKIFQIWGKPMIDLFASFQNKKMDLFCSWEHHQAAYAVDAFSITWN